MDLRILIAAVFLIASCREDVDQFVPLPDEDQPTLVKGDMLGRVWSPDGAPASGAQVLFHHDFSVTDESGLFFLPSVQAPQQAAALEIRKDGFFPAYRRIFWTEKTQLYTDIALFPKTQAGQFSIDIGGQVSLPQGGWIDFPAQAFQYPSGQPADGIVQVFAHWTDAVWEGGVQGLDEEGNMRYLASYGVLALEMTDEHGQPLVLIGGKNMDLHLPASASVSTLSLWSLNVQNGMWEEHGKSIQSGAFYAAKAGNGLYWNIAAPHALVQVKGWVQSAAGAPLRGIQVRAEGQDGKLLAQATTQNQGLFALHLPENMAVTLLFSDICGEVSHERELPPLPGNVSLPPLLWPDDHLALVKGRLLDCEHQPVGAGYIQLLWSDKEVFLPLSDGAFTAHLPICGQDVVTLVGFDVVRNFQTPPLSLYMAGTADAGDWILCNNSPEYVSFNLDGVVQISAKPTLTVVGNLVTISEPDLGLSLSFEGASPGLYPVIQQGFSIADLSFAQILSLDLQTNVARFDPPGGFVTGSFQGKATELTGVERSISGVFKLKRN